jgi:hypothetical protein
MPAAERVVLKQLPVGHRHMPEMWFLVRDPVTGVTTVGHTYWRVEEGGFREGEWTDRWPLAEAQGQVPEDIWRRAAQVVRGDA